MIDHTTYSAGKQEKERVCEDCHHDESVGTGSTLSVPKSFIPEEKVVLVFNPYTYIYTYLIRSYSFIAGGVDGR